MREAQEAAEVEHGEPAEQPRSVSWLWIWLLATLPFLGFWTYGLTDIDEGFYGAVTAEMNRRGEWITPFYNGHPWFEKPILIYWMTKPSLLLFGGVFGLRLPGALATLGLFAIVAWFCRRQFRQPTAQITVLILAGSLLVVGVGCWLSADPFLNLTLAGALLLFWRSLEGERRLRAASGFLLGCSVLAKGPVGILLFGAILGWTYWRQPALRSDFRGGWAGFLAFMLFAISAWYAPAYLRDGPMFVQKFLIEQNLERFLGGDQAHNTGPIGLLIYPLVLLLGMAPWSWIAFANWPKSNATPLERFLASWALIAFSFFSLSGTKLPHYILPAAVPIAILAAIKLGERLAPARHPEGMPELAPPPSGAGIEGDPNARSHGSGSLPLGAYAAAVIAVGLVVQGGFTFWYRSDNAELHRIATFVRLQGGSAAAYQMPRREKELGTLKPKIQETSHPSLAFYLDANVLEAEKLDELIRAPKPLWVITRMGRISDEDIRQIQRSREAIVVQPVEGAQNHYALYKMSLAPAR